MVETIQVNVSDKYGENCLSDSVVPKCKTGERKPEGFVELFTIEANGEKKPYGKHNLVVYQAREWVVERVMNVENASVNTTKDMFVSWLGVGNGGAPALDPLNPTSPVNTSTSLSNEVPINATDANCGDFRLGNYWKHPFDSVAFEQDADNGNKWLISKITTTLDTDDANGYNINEAGLYLSTSTAGGYSGDFYLFSVVTFPSIVKDTSRQIMFIWYLYF